MDDRCKVKAKDYNRREVEAKGYNRREVEVVKENGRRKVESIDRKILETYRA